MWNEPTKKHMENIPELYKTEGIPAKDKIIHMHFFFATGCDWYVAEYDPTDKVFYGFVILNDWLDCAEWGTFSLDELREMKVNGMEVDRDLHWSPVRAGDVKRICEAHAVQGRTWQRDPKKEYAA